MNEKKNKSRVKLDYAKIILAGIPIVFIVWIFLVAGLLIAFGSFKYPLFSSLGLALIVIFFYAFLAAKFADKIGATVLQADSRLSGSSEVMLCSLCGKERGAEEEFKPDPCGFCRSAVPICSDCFMKRYLTVHRRAFGVFMLFGLLGGIIWCLNPDSKGGIMWVNIMLYYIFSILLIVPHEIGHATAAILLDSKVLRIVLGAGKTMFTFKTGTWIWDIRPVPLGGLVHYISLHFRHYRLRALLIALAGPLSNVVIMILILCFYSIKELFYLLKGGVSPVAVLFVANFIQLVANLWPRKAETAYGTLPNDSFRILSLLFMSKEKLDKEKQLHWELQVHLSRNSESSHSVTDIQYNVVSGESDDEGA